MAEQKLTLKERRVASDARILASAIKCFGENGYTHSTMVGIAKGAGVTGGLLVQRYESKENLLGLAYEHVLGSFYTNVSKYTIVPLCLYKMIDELKNLKAVNKEHFNFFKMIISSTDLPDNFYKTRINYFTSKKPYTSLKEAQDEGIIVKGDLFTLFQAFMLQVINQIDISDRFKIPLPEFEYFLRVFQITNNELLKRNDQHYAIYNAFCSSFENLVYIYLESDEVDEIITHEDGRISGSKRNATGTYKRFVEKIVQEPYREKLLKLFDFESLDEKMGDRWSIYEDYVDINGAHKRIAICPVKRDANGKILDIIAGIQPIENT